MPASEAGRSADSAGKAKPQIPAPSKHNLKVENQIRFIASKS